MVAKKLSTTEGESTILKSTIARDHCTLEKKSAFTLMLILWLPQCNNVFCQSSFSITTHCCQRIRYFLTIAKNLDNIFALSKLFGKYYQFIDRKSWHKDTTRNCYFLQLNWLICQIIGIYSQKNGKNCQF